MTYCKYTREGKSYCDIIVNKSQSNGLLHFTHEINITFVKVNNEWVFHSAWHIGVSEMDWNSNEEDLFEETFPGLLAKVRKEIK